jgi:DNA ligase-1
MESKVRPMLAHTIEDTAQVQYPVLVSQKLDGIRCLIIDGVAVSRSLKPIRNEYVQSIIGRAEYNGLDGELIVGDAYATDCYRVTNSGVMSKDGEPDFFYYIFDRWDDTRGFADRYASLRRHNQFRRIAIVPHKWAYSEEDLLYIEETHLKLGAEGVMVRSLNGPYKQGRSTTKEGTLGKLKRFFEEEYEVVGFDERMRNENQATINELGYTERSSHKDNKTGRGDLGALVLRTKEGVVFRCGTGFDDELRYHIWYNQDNYLSSLVKVKSFSIGVKDAPRFPVFVGFRAKEDL